MDDFPLSRFEATEGKVSKKRYRAQGSIAGDFVVLDSLRMGKPQSIVRLRPAHQAKELLARAGIIADNAEQAAGGQRGSERVDAA
jgi:hypothetical protein